MNYVQVSGDDPFSETQDPPPVKSTEYAADATWTVVNPWWKGVVQREKRAMAGYE